MNTLKSVFKCMFISILVTTSILLCACGHEHAFGEWTTVKEASCTEDGLKERVCKCGEKETEVIPKTGHTFGEWTTAKEASCTEDGLKERVCKCGEKETEVIPKTGHTFGEWEITVEPNCVEEGLQVRSCKCGEEEQQVIPKTDPILSSDQFTLNAAYIDSSFDDKDLDLVYLFYTITADSKNLTASKVLIDVLFGEGNEYDPVTSREFVPRFTEYYYSDFNEDVYVGTSLNVCQTYKIPKGEFASEKVVRLKSSDKDIDVQEINFSSDSIKEMKDLLEICKDLNEDVYNKKHAILDAVDGATEAAIKNGLNGYTWTFYSYPSTYKMEFSAPNTFNIRVSGLQNTGTYTVHAGCLVLTYPGTETEIIIPYKKNSDGSPVFEDGALQVYDIQSQFGVYTDFDGRNDGEEE